MLRVEFSQDAIGIAQRRESGSRQAMNPSCRIEKKSLFATARQNALKYQV